MYTAHSYSKVLTERTASQNVVVLFI